VPFAYFQRLSAGQQRVYRQSDAITRLDVPAGVAMEASLARLRERLAADDRAGVQRAAQATCDELTRGFQVAQVRVRVLACRPVKKAHELHGLYELERGRTPIITVWMRTAAKRQVVAFKTFLRTLIHELCHHLDYALLKLADSFHTEGFYRRESALTSALLAHEEGRLGPGASPPKPQLRLF